MRDFHVATSLTDIRRVRCRRSELHASPVALTLTSQKWNEFWEIERSSSKDKSRQRRHLILVLTWDIYSKWNVQIRRTHRHTQLTLSRSHLHIWENWKKWTTSDSNSRLIIFFVEFLYHIISQELISLLFALSHHLITLKHEVEARFSEKVKLFSLCRRIFSSLQFLRKVIIVISQVVRRRRRVLLTHREREMKLYLVVVSSHRSWTHLEEL